MSNDLLKCRIREQNPRSPTHRGHQTLGSKTRATGESGGMAGVETLKAISGWHLYCRLDETHTITKTRLNEVFRTRFYWKAHTFLGLSESEIPHFDLVTFSRGWKSFLHLAGGESHEDFWDRESHGSSA